MRRWVPAIVCVAIALAAVPAIARTPPRPARVEVATLAGGCFWCMDAIFRELEGVDRVVSGFSGGVIPHPTYAEVSTGTTGYAETVDVTFEPRVLSTTFWPAENYHQDYFETHSQQPYCQLVIAPKVRKLRAEFLARLKARYRRTQVP